MSDKEKLELAIKLLEKIPFDKDGNIAISVDGTDKFIDNVLINSGKLLEEIYCENGCGGTFNCDDCFAYKYVLKDWLSSYYSCLKE